MDHRRHLHQEEGLAQLAAHHVKDALADLRLRFAFERLSGVEEKAADIQIAELAHPGRIITENGG